jgi:carbon-monoxide dehydrogenase large subunit
MAILRCPHAHARIRKLDLSAALSHASVLDAAAGRDVAFLTATGEEEDDQAHKDKGSSGEEEGGGERPPLAVDVARYSGEGIAAVVAVDAYAAQDAFDLLDVEWEPLPAYLHVGTTPAFKTDFAGQDADTEGGLPTGSARSYSTGDVEAAFAEAEVVQSYRFVNQRVAPVPMETRGTLCQYSPGTGELTVFTSSQCAQFVRDALADAFHLPFSKVRVIVPDVGGGFGCKIGSYSEDLLAAYFAMRLKRPVKWIETRSENFLTTVHGRDQVARVDLAARRDGLITGIRINLVVDTGAYDAGWLARTTAGMITGCYDVRNLQSEARSVFTHKTPLGAYRGAGRPEAAYFIERSIDCLARHLELDPAEVRRTNFIPPDRFPYKAADWPVFDSGEYGRSLDAALERSGRAELMARRDEARSQGRLVGVGLASYVEVAGFGWDTATLTIESDGTANLYTGISPHGQGQETSFSQIVGDICGIPATDVRVVYGDTALGFGQGTMGSRGTSVGGSAVYRAAVELREKMRSIASNLLEAAPEDLELMEFAWRVVGMPDRFETVRTIAKTAYSDSFAAEGMELGLRATNTFNAEEVTAPFGSHVAMVEVDPDTGAIQVLSFLTVDDCGTIISPQLVEGQVHGGVLQGASQALYEGVEYDPDGQLLTGSLTSYAVPTIGETVDMTVTHTETTSPRNDLGVKGVGEAGTIGSTPAIVNAVVDALSPLGIRTIDMPLSPERVWRTINGWSENGDQ